jgi:iron-sulfur cluster repair protein YtfE (RIC family)
MTEATDRLAALGEELRVLVRRHPRATWATHPDLGELAQFWLQRHALFRQVDGLLRGGIEAALADSTEAAELNPWLARHLGWLLGQLEEHHQVEDQHYFPLFRRAEPRLAAGFELLERDHATLHTALGGIVGRANLVLAHQDTDGSAFRADLARLRDAQVELGAQLRRHLDDEEDLVVPLLLERGERSLLGA